MNLPLTRTPIREEASRSYFAEGDTVTMYSHKRYALVPPIEWSPRLLVFTGKLPLQLEGGGCGHRTAVPTR